MQSGPDSNMETELGDWPRYLEQTVRWMRGGWRSNMKALMVDKKMWCGFPYSMYLALIYSLGKNSLIHDITLVTLLRVFLKGRGRCDWFPLCACLLGSWIVGIRVVKVLPVLLRYPSCVVYLPGYLVWLYFISLIRVYGFFTCGVTDWGTAKDATAVPSGETKDSEVYSFSERDSLLAGQGMD
jgi:hypothetical protein